MALSLLIGFLFDGKVTIGEIELDASITENHQLNNEVTQYPIEDGADLTDHIRTLPERITMKGFVTDTPLTFAPGAGLDALLEKRTLTTWGELKRISGRERNPDGTTKPPELITIVTSLDVYTNMAMTRLEAPRDSSTGKSISFTADFVHVEKPDSETVLIPGQQLSDADADLAASASDAGRQTPTEPGAQTKKLISALAIIVPKPPT